MNVFLSFLQLMFKRFQGRNRSWKFEYGFALPAQSSLKVNMLKWFSNASYCLRPLLWGVLFSFIVVFCPIFLMSIN